MKKVDLDVAADALALEQEIESRLATPSLAAVAEDSAETRQGGS